MKEKIKKFWRDYVDIAKMSVRFYKEHWLGYMIMLVATYGVGYGIGYIIEDIRSKKEREEAFERLEAYNKELNRILGQDDD